MPGRILLVEDDEDTRQLLAVALEVERVQVDQAANADEALSLLRANAYDLVLTDYDLPGKTGATLLAESIREGLLQDAGALMITAHPQPQAVEGVEVVRKPLDLSKFLQQVRSILRARPDAPMGEGCQESGPPDPALDLVLYVSANSLPSLRARQNLEEILTDPSLPVRLSICDVAQSPERAELDRVVFTPTLVKKTPPPRAWVLGDLSRASVVRDLLQACGIPVAS
jgi:DNA-binding response OmpR family regulator